MIIGVVKEVKNREQRVGLTPASVRALVASHHKIIVETQAGMGSGISDDDYLRAGASISQSREEVWGSDMVIKVKEPLPEEYAFLRPNQILFTYLHLAPERELTLELMKKKVTGIAYETIQEADGSLPLLHPMSEVAGRMSIQVGSFYLQSSWGAANTGRGILLGGVPGVAPGEVVILGGGVAGSNAAMVALGMGAHVSILDTNISRLEYLEHVLKGRLTTLMSNHDTIEETVRKADLVVGTVLLPGARAPKLVSKKLVHEMRPGSVIVDVAVDQGGCVETCQPTSHENPTFVVEGVIHYCVTNMPGAVSRTSTFALTNATLKYALMIANHGPEKAAKLSPAIRKGFNTYGGSVVYPSVAEEHDLRCEALPF